jgi:hypothetical protein
MIRSLLLFLFGECLVYDNLLWLFGFILFYDWFNFFLSGVILRWAAVDRFR